jgi:hypothetical protein
MCVTLHLGCETVVNMMYNSQLMQRDLLRFPSSIFTDAKGGVSVRLTTALADEAKQLYPETFMRGRRCVS